jgi:hypothetical protein
MDSGSSSEGEDHQKDAQVSPSKISEAMGSNFALDEKIQQLD